MQPEEDEEIQSFRKWSSSSRRPGIGGSSHVTPCEFIPLSAVKEYFEANQRVENLLVSLFGTEASRIDAEAVRNHYLRPLAILLFLGEGPMIKRFVRFRSLQDQHLPYRTLPKDFPKNADPNFFENFHKQQWQFCAAELEYKMDLYLYAEDILPVKHKSEIGRGGDAVVFEITVHEEYNKLVPPQWKMPVLLDSTSLLGLKSLTSN